MELLLLEFREHFQRNLWRREKLSSPRQHFFGFSLVTSSGNTLNYILPPSLLPSSLSPPLSVFPSHPLSPSHGGSSVQPTTSNTEVDLSYNRACLKAMIEKIKPSLLTPIHSINWLLLCGRWQKTNRQTKKVAPQDVSP